MHRGERIEYENPGVNQKIIISCEGQNSKRRRLKEFVEAGLIGEDKTSESRLHMKYYLTQKGEKFVKNWLTIEDSGDVMPTDFDAPPEGGHGVRRK